MIYKIFFIIFFVLLSYNKQAQSVTLAWDASPDPITGYKLHYDNESIISKTTPAKTIINVGNVLLVAVPDSNLDTKTFFTEF